MLLSLYKWSSISIIPESECRRAIAIAGLSLYKRKMEEDGSGTIPIQEEYRWIDGGGYLCTRGLEGEMNLSLYKRDKTLLTYIPCSQRERDGCRMLAATRLSLYKST